VGSTRSLTARSTDRWSTTPAAASSGGGGGGGSGGGTCGAGGAYAAAAAVGITLRGAYGLGDSIVSLGSLRAYGESCGPDGGAANVGASLATGAPGANGDALDGGA
jgi:hypothetical protein